jgi:hypothetical protein
MHNQVALLTPKYLERDSRHIKVDLTTRAAHTYTKFAKVTIRSWYSRDLECARLVSITHVCA